MIRTYAAMTFAVAGLAVAGGGASAPSQAPTKAAKPALTAPAKPAYGAPSHAAQAKPSNAPGGHDNHGAHAASSAHSENPSSPYDALMLLQSGNDRFVAGQPTFPNTGSERRADTATNGQKPFAIVLTCADSRIPVEQVFDRGVGDLFVVRVAGNICDTSEAATIEYGLEHLGAPLLVVMGHSGCGAVTAAASGAHVEGPLASLLGRIAPAVANAQRVYPDRQGPDLVQDAIRFNVWQSVEDLLKSSGAVRNLASTGKSKIVGAVYDLSTGRVQWMGEAPMQGAILASAGHDSPTVPSAVRKPVSAPAAAATHGSANASGNDGHH